MTPGDLNSILSLDPMDDRLALSDSEQSLSRAECGAAVAGIAAHLAKAGVMAGSVVAIELPRTYHWPLAALAVLSLGAVYLPVDCSQSRDYRIRGLKLGRATHRLVSPHSEDELDQFDEAASGCRVLKLPERLHVPSEPTPRLELESHHPAIIIFTSGSSGEPKPVVWSRGALAQYLEVLPAAVDASSDDVFVNTASPAFSASIRQTLLPFALGARQVIADEQTRRDPKKLADCVERNGVTVWDTTPSVFRAFTQRLAGTPRAKALAGLTTVQLTGEVLRWGDVRRWRDWVGEGTAIINLYSQTETCGSVAAEYVSGAGDEADDCPVPVGRPIGDVQLSLLPVPDSGTNEGEITVTSRRLSEGYLGFGPDTQARFELVATDDGSLSRRYRTGDLGRLDAQGRMTVLGSISRRVKIRGQSVDLDGVTRLVETLPGIERALVLAEEGTNAAGLRVLVEASTDMSALNEALRDTLASVLPGYAIPFRLEPVPEIPRTMSGKSRHGIAAETEGVDKEAPLRPGKAGVVERIWRRLLNHPQISDEDDFFALGGDSLLAVIMIAEVEVALGLYDLPGTLAQTGSFAAFMALVEGGGDPSEGVMGSQPAPGRRSQSEGSDTPGVAKASSSPKHINKTFMERVTSGWTGERITRNGVSVFAHNRSGSRAPIFWCFNAKHEPEALAAALGPDQPLYAMRSLGAIFDSQQEKMVQEPKIAGMYASLIAEMFPGESCIIGGNCQGARVAYHTAMRLVGIGHPVLLLAALDKVPPGPWPGRLALFFGRDSDLHNPFLKFAAPQIGWSRHFRDTTWDILPAGHGQFFQDGTVSHLADKLIDRAEQAATMPMQILPAAAYSAAIDVEDVPKRLAPGATTSLGVRIRAAADVGLPVSDETGIFLVAGWQRPDADSTSPAARVALREAIPAGASTTVRLDIIAPDEVGSMELRLDLVEEGVCLFSERGMPIWAAEIVVAPQSFAPRCGSHVGRLRGVTGAVWGRLSQLWRRNTAGRQ